MLENLVAGRGGGDSGMAMIACAANTARLVDSHENVVVLFDVLEAADVPTACGAIDVLRR